MKGDADTLSAHAQYFVKFVQAYAEQGINIQMVAPQNEPGYSGTYPTCAWAVDAYRDFVGVHLGPALANAGLGKRRYSAGQAGIALHAKHRHQAQVEQFTVFAAVGIGIQIGQSRIPVTANVPGATVKPGAVPVIPHAELIDVSVVGIRFLAISNGHGIDPVAGICAPCRQRWQ